MGGRIGPQGVPTVTAEQLKMQARHSIKNRQNARDEHKRKEMNHNLNVLTTFGVLGSPEAFSN